MNTPVLASLLCLVSVMSANAVVSDPKSDTTGPRPNFLVLLCDDLGSGDLACYGHPQIRTPNLDRLAQQGVLFTSCSSAAPVCLPSHAGFLTGRNSARADIYDWIPDFSESSRAGLASQHLVHLRKGEVTLARLLQQAGYATALVGKWHCNAAFNQHIQAQPNDLGFDHWFATQYNAVPSHQNPTNSLDLLPTFCALAGAKIPRGLKLDGADLRPLFDGQPVKRDQPLFWGLFPSAERSARRAEWGDFVAHGRGEIVISARTGSKQQSRTIP